MAKKSVCYWSKDHVKAKSLVVLAHDNRRYIYIDELGDDRKAQFLAAAKKLNKKYYDLIENDDFVQAIKKEFNATVVIEQKSFNRAMNVKKR